MDMEYALEQEYTPGARESQENKAAITACMERRKAEYLDKVESRWCHLYMLTSFTEIKERIICEYQPESIILYGSRVAGTADDMSDYDILIVKRSGDRPADRRMAVERIIADRSIAVDLMVYTPEEVRSLYAMGSPFITEVIDTGKVVYMRKNTQAWIDDARDDLESARLLYENGRYKTACYHSQQSVEKGLKALIIEKGERPERVHDIIGLTNRVKTAGWDISFSTDDMVFLNSIYKGRYPTEEGLLPHGLPGEGDARRALSAAETAMKQIGSLLE
jgi:HEPN domain-containing protein/predicted nucleotidyltransferase